MPFLGAKMAEPGQVRQPLRILTDGTRLKSYLSDK